MPTLYTRVEKNLHVADTLSRQPLRTTTDSATTLQNDITAHVYFISSSWPASDAFLERIKDETAKDERLSIALTYTAKGWPDYKEDCQLGARHLYQARSELSISDGLLLKDDRIIIPATLQKEVLGRIHQGHFGITKCRERAASSVWWPGISKDISDLIGKCRVCQETREPLSPSPLPQRPFQQMAAELRNIRPLHVNDNDPPLPFPRFVAAPTFSTAVPAPIITTPTDTPAVVPADTPISAPDGASAPTASPVASSAAPHSGREVKISVRFQERNLI
ncbi:hypothetical protein RRG08_043143 [Elysia crispata]|uniref:Integrase zinc-binding domain-containing protein n=1 Tax=Elysia crispata TaxID=231223 RepID=A0AAE1D1G2_9GAST|nr:hypothetical protein RRG08_043143 [Elysia crispata]